MKELNSVELCRLYQKVFSTAEGITVLSDILSLLGYFGNQSQRMNPELLAVANTLLDRCNVFNGGNVEDYVKNMLSCATPKTEDESDRLFGDLRRNK